MHALLDAAISPTPPRSSCYCSPGGLIRVLYHPQPRRATQHARAVRQLRTTNVDQRRICLLDALTGGLRNINLQLITLASDILLQLELSSDIYRALPCPPST
jgi:hypothetical protein